MKYLRILICLVLSLCIIFTCGGCGDGNPQTSTPQVSDQPLQLNDTYHGRWFVNDQLTEESFTFSISGSIPAGIQPDGSFHEATCSVRFPEDFSYGSTSDQPNSCHGLSCADEQCAIMYMLSGSCSDKSQPGKPVPLMIYLCPQNGYAIVRVGSSPVRYIVASTDPNMDTSQIMAHFPEYVFQV